MLKYVKSEGHNVNTANFEIVKEKMHKRFTVRIKHENVRSIKGILRDNIKQMPW